MSRNPLAVKPLSSDEALLTQLCTASALTLQQANYTRRVTRSLSQPATQVLRLLRMVSDTDIAKALAAVHGLPGWWPDATQVDSTALAQLPFSFARQHHMLPVHTIEGALCIATDEPGDLEAQQRLRRHVQGEVRWMVAPRAALAATIEMAYRAASHPSAEELERELARVGSDLDGGRLVRLALADGVERGASDVHFTPSGFALLVSFRIDGVLQLQHVLPSAMHVRVASAIKVEAGMDIGESRRPQDGSYSLTVAGQPFDLRVSTMPTTHGENLVVRILSMRGDVLPLDQCGFWPEQVNQIERLMRAPDGLVLVTGPTGSGKTTTLYAGLRMINALERNIMTVEDPVEYHVPLVRQVRLNDRAGMSFASAVKGFLRQDPDVMLVGEIRDAETASMAIRAAQTGHLVPASLHTNDAAGAISRLRDLGVPDYLLSASLRGVIAQRLVRKLCKACRLPAEGSRFRAVGCSSCNQTGYRSRLAVGEVLLIDDEARTLIDQQAGESAIRRNALARGFKPMRAWAQLLVDAGVTDSTELDRVFGGVSA
ncbi:MAG: GspE/PulE family protein [Hydrogenophaga sp.]|uniref:GspE/PulE family protein n=1 Tax=Hydrogenophaga sp. TaxID=1904254 RepID=UPI002AB9B142|nr:GspE/PulE family protein [Hydrogenophaga sp.]MDZ4101013.1 GspE/PulE family protein [Hydrogenophaga sp.]